MRPASLGMPSPRRCTWRSSPSLATTRRSMPSASAPRASLISQRRNAGRSSWLIDSDRCRAWPKQRLVNAKDAIDRRTDRVEVRSHSQPPRWCACARVSCCESAAGLGIESGGVARNLLEHTSRNATMDAFQLRRNLPAPAIARRCGRASVAGHRRAAASYACLRSPGPNAAHSARPTHESAARPAQSGPSNQPAQQRQDQRMRETTADAACTRLQAKAASGLCPTPVAQLRLTASPMALVVQRREWDSCWRAVPPCLRRFGSQGSCQCWLPRKPARIRLRSTNFVTRGRFARLERVVPPSACEGGGAPAHRPCCRDDMVQSADNWNLEEAVWC